MAKKVIQYSVDVMVDEETNLDKLQNSIFANIDSIDGVKVCGIAVESDMTAMYKSLNMFKELK